MKPSLFAACAVALLVPAAHAAAQEQPDTVVVEGERSDVIETEGPAGTISDPGVAGGGGSSESVTSYTPEYFSPYNPTNANDMVNRVPGFNAQGGGNARGFGQNAGNVLINGERPSAKSQDVGDILQRIPVADVVRIDLIRGQVAGIDMGGQTVVVNVIRRVSTRSGGTWRLQANYNTHTGEVAPNGEINRNMTILGANVSIGVSTNNFPQGQHRDEYIYTPDGALFQHNFQNRKGGPRGWAATFNADRDIGEWTLRLNGRVSDGGFGNDEYGRYVAGLVRPRGLTADPRIANFGFPFEKTVFDNDQTEAELGGDLERDLNSEMTLKIIALQGYEKENGLSTFASYDAAGFISELTSDRESTSGESILRSFVTWIPASNVSIETGAEAAYNYLDSANAITVDSGSGPVAIPLAIANTKVEELRAEPYISGLWRPTSNLALDASLAGEVSQIKQTGDAEQTRDFFYPKGSASVTWDAFSNTQLRFSIEKTVGQLSFNDFASSVSFNDNTQDTGNPDLVPEQTWTAQVVAEQRFWDDGVLTLEYTRDWISDASGLVPLGGGGEGPGNLGDADRWKARVALDVPLDRIGIEDARVQTSYEYGESEVVDPVTGEIRLLSGGGGNNFFGGGNGRRSFRLDFRKDYPEAGFSWGFDYNNNSSSYSYRIAELTANSFNNGGVGGFVETTRFFGVNMRLQIGNIGRFYGERIRYIYAGPRDVAPITVVEKRKEYNELMINFRIRGTF